MILEGDPVTIMLEGVARCGVVKGFDGSKDVVSFLCTLEADPARSLPGGIAVVLVEGEGTLWLPGWDEETAGALRAGHALGEGDRFNDNLLVRTGLTPAQRRAR